MYSSGSKKRKYEELEEFQSLSSVRPSSDANIHGILLSVSNLRGKGKKFFEGEIQDDSGTMRIVGFHSDARKRLLEFMGKSAIELVHCEIQYARASSEMEIVVTKSTAIRKSDKLSLTKTPRRSIGTMKGGKPVLKINRYGKSNALPSPKKGKSPKSGKSSGTPKKSWVYPDSITPLNEVEDIEPFEEVAVEIQVDSIGAIATVNDKKKQEVVVSDDRGTTNLTLWGVNVGKLRALKSYRLSGIIVDKDKGKTFLTTTVKKPMKIEKISGGIAKSSPKAKVKRETEESDSDDNNNVRVKRERKEESENSDEESEDSEEERNTKAAKIKKEKKSEVAFVIDTSAAPTERDRMDTSNLSNFEENGYREFTTTRQAQRENGASTSSPPDTDMVTIIGVDQFDTYTGCMRCRSEVLCIDNASIGECASCHMVQAMTECPTLLKSMVIVKDGRATKIPLVVYHQQILEIAQLPANEITPMVLLKAEKFSMDYYQGIIKSVSRNK